MLISVDIPRLSGLKKSQKEEFTYMLQDCHRLCKVYGRKSADAKLMPEKQRYYKMCRFYRMLAEILKHAGIED